MAKDPLDPGTLELPGFSAPEVVAYLHISTDAQDFANQQLMISADKPVFLIVDGRFTRPS